MDYNVTVKQDNSPVARLKNALSHDSVRQQFENALKENSALFVASLIDLYASDKYLQNCEPRDVIMEALKAATLKLPINKSLGFAYIVPYKNNKVQKYEPTFIIGYKGYLQLAQRTGQYKFINADIIYEGETVEEDKLTGAIFFGGEATSEKAIGYFAYIETVNGFRKPVYWTRKKVEEHAKKYSQSYSSPYSPWQKQFDTMGIKTVLRHLLSRYGVMSIDMMGALDYDAADFKANENEAFSNKMAEHLETHDRAIASYEARKPPAQSKVVDLRKPQDEPPTAQEPPPESSEQTEPPPEKDNQQDQTGQTEDSNGNGEGSNDEWEDDFGTPSDHPLNKKKWAMARKGTFKDGTGLKAYIHFNREYIKDLNNKAFACLFDKYKNIYGESMPWGRHGEILNGADREIAEEEKPRSKADILNSPIAIKLAELANKHPDHYKLIVQGRIPESIEQIVTWVEQINTMVVNARLNSNL